MIPLTKYDVQASVEQWGRDEIYPDYINKIMWTSSHAPDGNPNIPPSDFDPKKGRVPDGRASSSPSPGAPVDSVDVGIAVDDR